MFACCRRHSSRKQATVRLPPFQLAVAVGTWIRSGEGRRPFAAALIAWEDTLNALDTRESARMDGEE